jgi:4-carboxymuconolactone decarboxylase
MNVEQKALYEKIAGTRQGVVRGPFAIWLRTPPIAQGADQLGNAVRLQGKLDPQLFEFVILMVARHWTAQYEWFAHVAVAAQLGLSADLIEAIRTRRQPDFPDARFALIYDLINELHDKKRLSDEIYNAAVEAFGVDQVIEIIGTAGFYTLVAMTLNAFEAPVPDGSVPLG